MPKLTAVALLCLLAALTACSSGWAPGNGYYVEFGACESEPLGDRATPTPEQWQPTVTPTPTQTAKWCVVTTGGDRLRVRTGPGTGWPSTSSISDGTSVTYTDERDGWYFIGDGWVAGWLLVCNG
jgi:uncharacterized protein YgiM (DUF1202 family)